MKRMNAGVGVLLALGVFGASGCGKKAFKGNGDQETPAASPNPDPGKASKDGAASGQGTSPAPNATTPTTQSSGNSQGNGSGANGWTAANLAKACASQPVKTQTVIVQIRPNDGYRCAFGTNGNLAAKSATLAARLEQSVAIPGTAGRVICSMNAETGNQTIRYDDQLFLSINNNLIVSSSAAAKQFEKAPNGFLQYNWERIRGAGTGSEKFCAEGVSCNLPRSETFGNFNFSLSSDANSRLFSSLSGQQLSVGLVITGDDDPALDCQLDTGMNLTFTYSYIGQ